MKSLTKINCHPVKGEGNKLTKGRKSQISFIETIRRRSSDIRGRRPLSERPEIPAAMRAPIMPPSPTEEYLNDRAEKVAKKRTEGISPASMPGLAAEKIPVNYQIVCLKGDSARVYQNPVMSDSPGVTADSRTPRKNRLTRTWV